MDANYAAKWVSFRCKSTGKTHKVHDLQYLIKTGSSHEGVTNLAGIPLKKLRMDRITVTHTSFYLAEFQECSIGDVTFVDCSFIDCLFKQSRLSGQFFQHSQLSHANLDSSHLNAMVFDDVNLSSSIKFLKISYFQLIFFIFQCWYHKDERYFAKKSWTDFVWVDVNKLSRSDTAEFKHYVIWYQRSMSSVRAISGASIPEALFTIIQATTSKFWSSFRALALSSTVLILFFALAFFVLKTGFSVSTNATAIPNFWDLAEFSFKIFTNAGFSEVKPITPMARIFVIVESISGYLMLAILVLLLSKKISINS